MNLDEIRAAQHPDERTQSDAALEWFLTDTTYAQACLDLAPSTPNEIRHLAHNRRAA
jgi:hypothetical protein